MASTLHIGTKRVQTLTASDSSTIPLGTVTASSNAPGVITAAVDPATNLVTVTGVASGSGSVTYSAHGYLSVQESFTVAQLPSLIVTDGPEQ